MKKNSTGKTRTKMQIVEHYEIEKELAAKLRNAKKEERKKYYTELYDELFKRVSHHPQLTRKFNPEMKRKEIASQIKLLSRFFSPDKYFMEVGSGDCALSVELCNYFKNVYAIDVSKEMTNNLKTPINFELIITDGTSINVKPETIDVAYSNHLMEHLHPEDALEQLQNIYNSLVPDGIYICQTPHRFMGPVDISRDFDEVATGFHLKEYTNKELISLFYSVGFRKVQSIFGIKDRYSIIPICPMVSIEWLINPLPYSLRKKISKMVFIRKLLTVQLIAIK